MLRQAKQKGIMGPHSATGETDVTSAHASCHTEAKGTQHEAGTLTLARKVALCAGLMASESMVVFSNLNEMPLQQALGTPVYLLTLPGVVAAITALVLVPVMGWIADGGSQPYQRKKPVSLAAFCMGFLGMSFNLSAAILAASKSPLHSPATNWSSSTEDPVTNASKLFSALTPLPLNGSYLLTGFNAFGTEPDDVSDLASITTQITVSPAAHGFSDLPLPAVLSMMGFIVMDLAFDLTNSAVKALMLTHSSPADHVSLLVTGVVIAALGGCSTSVSGLVDLGSVFPGIDPVFSQAIAQLATLITLSVLCCTCSLLTASRTSPPAHFPSGPSDVEGGHQEKARQSSGDWMEDMDMTSELIPREGTENALFPDKTSDEAFMHNSTQLEHSFRRLTASVTKSQSLSAQPHNLTNEHTRLRPDSSGYDAIVDDEATETPATASRTPSSLKIKLFTLYLAGFFSASNIFIFYITIADFVGKVIYGGNPQAQAGSEDYSLYQQGMRTAALCVLFLNVAYMISALCQNRVLALIGPKTEYVAVNLLVLTLLMVMRQTASLWAVFVTSAVMGLSRAALYTVPFVLATQLCCQQPQTEAQRAKRKKSSFHFGSVMALMTSSLPSALLVANAIIGPLVDATGDPSSPMLIGMVFSLLAVITVSCYKAQR